MHDTPYFRLSCASRPTQTLTKHQKELVSTCETACRGGKRPSAEQESTIKSLVRDVERVNPTRKPALSQAIDGNWRLLYSDAPGVSSGRLGPLTGTVFQDVELASKTYTNLLLVGDEDKPWVDARLRATWDVVDGKTWKVIFDDITVKVFGVTVLRQQFTNVTRFWSMSYLDNDLRVMRGRRPEKPEDDAYVFVMQRAERK